jgi:hypothetical protein
MMHGQSGAYSALVKGESAGIAARFPRERFGGTGFRLLIGFASITACGETCSAAARRETNRGWMDSLRRCSKSFTKVGFKPALSASCFCERPSTARRSTIRSRKVVMPG